jgi:allantoin racemase
MLDPDARSRVLTEITAAITEDRCEAVILGCAGMADLAGYLSREAGILVINAVIAGVRLVEALTGAGFNTSKIGAYATPRKKHPA